jgi:hypothetical protein
MHGMVCGCGCGAPLAFTRRFLSPEEKAERLESYRQELLKEAAELERQISSLTQK